MVNEQIMKKYSSSIKNIQKQSVEAGLTEEDFKKMYSESLNMVMKEKSIPQRNKRGFINKHKFKIILCSILLISFLYNTKTIYNSLLCNLQEYIHSGLRVLRHLSMPLLSLFPSLTVHEMDCWPCSTISHVIEIHNPKPWRQQYAPFIFKTDQVPIRINNLKYLYETHQHTLDEASTTVLIDNKYYSTIREVFGNEMLGKDKTLYVWQSNDMDVARILRKIIPKPKFVPKVGQSTRRFIIIDSSQTHFPIPDNECSYSFLMVLSGSRVADLRPSAECKHQCKSLEVELKESYLLWYNWWYWKPVIRPSYYGNETFIAHVGSYC